MRKTRGLILGKFAPFHVRHSYLIESALKKVDELIVIVYDCPDITTIPLNVRANWIRKLYPNVIVIEGWDAPNRHENTDEVKSMQEEYVRFALNGKKITHFFSSEYYGEHMSKFLGAIDARTNRNVFMISATKIRGDKFRYRRFMNPLIYKDILIKVAFIGMPSKEQSKLVKAIAKRLRTIYIENNLISSFNSKQINNIKASKDPDRFYKIGVRGHKEANRKNKIFLARDYLLYDSMGFICHLLSIATHNRFNEKLYRSYSDELRQCDLIFVNNTQRSIVARKFNIDSSIFLNQLISNLETLRVNYKMLTGTFGEKLAKSERLIKSMHGKFIGKSIL